MHNAHHHYRRHDTPYAVYSQWPKMMMNALTPEFLYKYYLLRICIIYYSFRNKKKEEEGESRRKNIPLEMEPIKCIYLGFFFGVVIVIVVFVAATIENICYLLSLCIWRWWWMVLARAFVYFSCSCSLSPSLSLLHSLTRSVLASSRMNVLTRVNQRLPLGKHG